MFRKGIRVVGHAGHSMSHLDSFVIAGSETHRPIRKIVTRRAEAEIELSQWEIRLNRFVDFGQRNGFHRRKHFTQITRQIPPGSQLPEKATNRIETAAFIQSPDVERFLRGGRSSVSLSCLTRQSQPVFVKPPRWHAVGSTNDLLPLRLRSRDVAVVTGKGMFRLEVLVVPDQRQPVWTGGNAISPRFQSISLHRIARADPDEDIYLAVGCLGDDRQSCATDLFDLRPKLLGRDSLHASGSF